MTRIVLLTNGNYFAAKIAQPLFSHPAIELAGIVIVTGDYKGKSGLVSYKELLRATALPYLVYKVASTLGLSFLSRMLGKKPLTVRRLAQEFQVPAFETVKVNSPESVAFVEAHQPDILLSISCPQRILKKLLSIPKKTSINIHSSLLPAYAGLAPYFWVLANGETRTGTTVHEMIEEIDKGRILAQRETKIPKGISAFSLFQTLADKGSEALVEAILNPESIVLKEPASYYSHPTKGAYRALRRNGHCLVRLSELIKAAKG